MNLVPISSAGSVLSFFKRAESNNSAKLRLSEHAVSQMFKMADVCCWSCRDVDAVVGAVTAASSSVSETPAAAVELLPLIAVSKLCASRVTVLVPASLVVAVSWHATSCVRGLVLVPA